MRHFMADIIYHSDFRTLRQAYLEVKHFIEKEACVKVDSLKTKIVEDLGCSGDDNCDLLSKFVTKYKLDVTNFNYSKHFESEMELFDSSATVLNLFISPILITVWLIKIFTRGKVNKREWIPNWHRSTLDMTFGDMLTWYLTGKYNLRHSVKVTLKNAA